MAADYRQQRRQGGRRSQVTKEELKNLDYKDTQLLRKFMTDRGKIKPRRVTGVSTQDQHKIATAIKRARYMALMPYIVPVISGRGDRRNR